MKKGFKKILALAIVLTMAMSFVPFALAVSGDITTLTIKGVAVDIENPPSTTIAAAKTATVTLELTQEQLDDDSTVPVLEIDSPSDPFVRIIIGDDATIVDMAGLFGASMSVNLDARALKVGDIIYAGDSDHGRVARIVIALKVTSTDPKGELEGEGDFTEVPYNVVVPTVLNFAVDPYEINKDNIPGNQLSGANFAMANKSPFAVKVSFDITVEDDDESAVFVASVGDVEPDDFDAKEDKIFFGALGASGAATVAPTFEDGLGELASHAFKYEWTGGQPVASIPTVESPTLVAFAPDADGETAEGSIAFLLGAATESDPGEGLDLLAANNAGVASFQFFANFNTYADNFKAGEVALKITGGYEFVGVRSGTATELRKDALIEDSLNQFEVEEEEVVVTLLSGFLGNTNFPLPTGVEIARDYERGLVKASLGNNAQVPFRFADGVTIDEIVVASTGNALVATTDYNVSGNNITFSATRMDLLKTNNNNTIGAKVEWNIFLVGDSVPYKLTWVME